jgi:adenine deaminase
MLADEVAHTMRAGLSTLAPAWRMASTNPARCIGLPKAPALVAGSPANYVLFELIDDHVDIRQTYKSGRLSYDADADTARTQSDAA